MCKKVKGNRKRFYINSHLQLFCCKEGKFHIYAISTIDEGIEILTGVPAGKRNKDGKYPAGTIKHLAYEKLEKYNKNANKQSK